MKKRLLATLLAVVLVVGMLPSAFAMTSVKVTKKGQVVDSITFNGVTVNAIYAPRATVSNYSTDTTYSCAAFVSKFYKQVYGITVNNLVKDGGGPKASKGSFSKTTSPKVGDVVHRKTSTSTHWAIVKAVSGNTITLIEQNAWYSKAEDKARVGKTYDLSDSAVTVYRYSGAETGAVVAKPSYWLHYYYDNIGSVYSEKGSTFTIISEQPTKKGYTFLGWSKDINATSPSYRTGDSITIYEETILYTIWKGNCDNGHTWGSWAVVKEATCEMDGSQERKCSVCGAVENQTLPSVNHSWGLWKTVWEASCEEDGLEARECEVCGETETQDTKALGHDYQVKQETNTSTLYVCQNCWDSYLEENPTVADNSSMDNFIIKKHYFDGLFWDVTSSDWFNGNVSTAYSMGLMNGRGSGIFAPRDNMTIAEVVTLAARVHSIYYTGSDSFPTYDGGNWYDPYVNYARNNGIISENYTFNRPATREQVVHILAKALPQAELANTVGSISFADSIDITYMADVRLLSGAGVIDGFYENGSTYFKPLDPITRAQVAAIVGRMVQPSTRVG